MNNITEPLKLLFGLSEESPETLTAVLVSWGRGSKREEHQVEVVCGSVCFSYELHSPDGKSNPQQEFAFSSRKGLPYKVTFEGYLEGKLRKFIFIIGGSIPIDEIEVLEIAAVETKETSVEQRKDLALDPVI